MDPTEQLQRLTQRVFRLEQELARLSRQLGVPESPQVQPPASVAPSGIAAPAATPILPVAATERSAARDEADVFGTWFARAGALALLMGAGFAFKYAIDRGIIGPAGRVLVGLIAGGALIAAGEWAMRKRWEGFAQAVGAGGVALMYLSVLAAIQLYDLVAPGPGFFFLVLVTAAGGALALRHDSVALAAFAVVGAFLNPFLAAIGARPDPVAVFLYLVALDLLVLAVALRRWQELDLLAAAGTAIVFAAVADRASFGEAALTASLLFTIFLALPFVRAAFTERPAEQRELGVVVAASFAYVSWMLEALADQGYAGWRGTFMLVVALAFALLGLAARAVEPPVRAPVAGGAAVLETTPLGTTMFALAAAALAVLAAVELEGYSVPVAWALQGTALVALGSLRGYRGAQTGGAILLSLAAFGTLMQLAQGYEAERLLFSGASASLLLEIVALYVAAVFFARYDDEPARQGTAASVIAANVLTVAWLSFEAMAAIDRSGNPFSREQAVAFSLTAIWGLYGALLLFVGVSLRSRGVRLMAATLLAIVIAKLAVSDLWLLRTAYRVIAFIGLGVVLLVCSLMYQRLRDLVMEPDEPVPGAPLSTPGAPPPAGS